MFDFAVPNERMIVERFRAYAGLTERMRRQVVLHGGFAVSLHTGVPRGRASDIDLVIPDSARFEEADWRVFAYANGDSYFDQAGTKFEFHPPHSQTIVNTALPSRLFLRDGNPVAAVLAHPAALVQEKIRWVRGNKDFADIERLLRIIHPHDVAHVWREWLADGEFPQHEFTATMGQLESMPPTLRGLQRLAGEFGVQGRPDTSKLPL